MTGLTVGGSVLNYVNGTGDWILAIVIGLVGIGLIIAGVIDLYKGLGHTNKDMKAAGIGFVVLILGGLLLAWSVGGVKGFFTKLGRDVPHK